MTPSLFRSGLIPRLVGAIGFAAAAFGMVALLREPARAQATRTPAVPPAESIETTPTHAGVGAGLILEIESVQPIASWSVRLDGETPEGARFDGYRWSADVASGAVLLAIDATSAAEMAGAGENRPNALRLRLRGERTTAHRLEWIHPGDTLLLPFDELRAETSPSSP